MHSHVSVMPRNTDGNNLSKVISVLSTNLLECLQVIQNYVSFKEILCTGNMGKSRGYKSVEYGG